MLSNAYLLVKIGADTAENEQHFAENLPIGRRVADRHPCREGPQEAYWDSTYSRLKASDLAGSIRPPEFARTAAAPRNERFWIQVYYNSQIGLIEVISHHANRFYFFCAEQLHRETACRHDHQKDGRNPTPDHTELGEACNVSFLLRTESVFLQNIPVQKRFLLR